MGLSPVNSNASYRKPPNVHPKNGATIGTWECQTRTLLLVSDGTYPEVIITGRPYIVAVSCKESALFSKRHWPGLHTKEVRHQPWTEVPC
jgi:hypothetical protein